MNTTELIKYELPWYAEYVSNGWLQDIIAKRCSKRIMKKLARYNRRIKLEEFAKNEKTS